MPPGKPRGLAGISATIWLRGAFTGHRLPRKPRSRKKRGSGPGLARIFEEMGALFARDLANAERGLYPLPRDQHGSPAALIDRSRRYFADPPWPRNASRKGGVAKSIPPSSQKSFPPISCRIFTIRRVDTHGRSSAKLYDIQVEVLFSGTANAMRRQCLVPIAEFIRGKDQRKLSLLDVASGTGRFVRFLKQAFPRSQGHRKRSVASLP